MTRRRPALLIAVAVVAVAGCAPVPRSEVDPTALAAGIRAATLSVAKVTGTSCSGGGVVGSGFVVGDHLVLTVAHVAGDARTIELQFPGAQAVAAQVVRVDPDDDTALLRVEGELPAALGLAAVPAAVGDPVGMVGFPIAGSTASSQVARITAVDDDVIIAGRQLHRLLVFDGQVPPGSSGGPILDAAGRVHGMVSAQISGRAGRDSSPNVTLAIPAARLVGKLAAWGGLPVRLPCA